jgi:hypothetical protein
MSKDTFMAALNMTQNRYPTNFFMHGEPLLHPNVIEYMGIAKDRGIFAVIHTNGVFLNREKLIALEKYLGRLEISLHTLESLDAFKQTLAYLREIESNMEIVGNLILTNPLANKIASLLGEDIKFIKLQPTHRWTNDKQEKIPGERKSNCIFPLWDWCGIKWDGRVVSCCFDFEGKNTLGFVGDNNLKHHTEDYQICSTCTPVWKKQEEWKKGE